MTSTRAWNQISDLEAAVLRTKGHQEGGEEVTGRTSCFGEDPEVSPGKS